MDESSQDFLLELVGYGQPPYFVALAGLLVAAACGPVGRAGPPPVTGSGLAAEMAALSDVPIRWMTVEYESASAESGSRRRNRNRMAGNYGNRLHWQARPVVERLPSPA